MSCMEHTCIACGHMDFNNSARTPSMCPRCGGNMHHVWDEQADYDRERTERNDEED
jgi:predicted  nucleic acid-binding Zn-ribbon protein